MRTLLLSLAALSILIHPAVAAEDVEPSPYGIFKECKPLGVDPDPGIYDGVIMRYGFRSLDWKSLSPKDFVFAVQVQNCAAEIAVVTLNDISIEPAYPNSQKLNAAGAHSVEVTVQPYTVRTLKLEHQGTPPPYGVVHARISVRKAGKPEPKPEPPKPSLKLGSTVPTQPSSTGHSASGGNSGVGTGKTLATSAQAAEAAAFWTGKSGTTPASGTTSDADQEKVREAAKFWTEN